ncbi:S41 family peptidase [Pseudoalteromonas xiamenensis]
MIRFLVLILMTYTGSIAANTAQEIDEIARIVKAQFVSEAVAKKVADDLVKPSFQSKMLTIDDPHEFAKQLTEALRIASGDNHIGVVYSPSDVQRYRVREQAKTSISAQSQQAINRAKEVEESALANFGIQQVRVLDGQVGYLEMSYFDGFVDESAPVFEAAMNMLAGSKAIILDLRRNGGGNSRILPLFLGYFLGPESIHFATKTERWKHTSEQLFTMADVRGHRHFDKPLFILTSGTTFSLAEHVTYHLRAFNRAVVVGERTYGGGKAFDPIIVSDDFYLRMPRVDIVNAITKTMYEEGKGITPDVETTAQAAFYKAYLLALSTLKELNNEAKEFDYEWVKRVVRAQAKTIQTQPTLSAFTGRHRFANYEFEFRQNELWMSYRELPWVKLVNLEHGYFFDDRAIQRQFSFSKTNDGWLLSVYFADRLPEVILEN